MSNSIPQITCPNCGYAFNAEEALQKRLLERLEREYQEKAKQQGHVLKQQRQTLEQERHKLERDKAEHDALFEKELAQRCRQLEAVAAEKAKESLQQRLQALEAEIDTRKQENLELKRKEVELLRREAAIKDERDRLQLETEKKLLERQADIEGKVREAEQEKISLRFREYEKKLEDQKKLIEEMKRRAEQGSVQMQGEVQELALREILSALFAFDRIDEVPKGVRGADVIQTVVNSMQQECGKIIYESKRTKAFSNEWIAKLKADQVEQGADIAVIVTETMASDMDRFGQRDGVWLCTFVEVGSLAFALREMLLQLYSARVAQENKGDKMELMYSYLTSVEFRQRIEAIVEGFSELKIALDREKNAMLRIWKSREKQIEKIMNNTIDMFGAVKGIAGNSVASIPSLDLPALEGDTDIEVGAEDEIGMEKNTDLFS
ncbi:MAG: DUF2130 domain-containing protein [Gammaproteobacteria bacterium]|nr:DUF2130 domain-containing protein [Gammaproteobacteria bacterium]